MTDQTQAPQEQPGVSLQDLSAAVQIIDICSKRGAFEGAELEQVGQLRTKLVTFLQANAPQEEGQEATEGEVVED